MLAVSSPIFDLNGDILFQQNADSDLSSFTRRVSRTATLDGGSVLDDKGFSDSDRTLTVTATLTEEQAASVEYILQTYAQVVVATDSGVYLCGTENVSNRQPVVTMRLLVVEKLS